ncbi:MAG TPA: anthranilate synthase component I family protein [Bacteroidia bacterium]
MKKISLHIHGKRLLADTLTPVSIYLRVRDKFPGSLLLESSDYHGNENSFSFICCGPIATISVSDHGVKKYFPGGTTEERKLEKGESLSDVLSGFRRMFDMKNAGQHANGIHGLFGYTAYDAVKYFENIPVHAAAEEKKIPDLVYSVYRYVIAIDHFRDEMFLYEYSVDENSTLDRLEAIIFHRGVAQYKFNVHGKEHSDLTDEEFVKMVKKGKEECRRGNIFQVVLSREFRRSFTGDEFNLYRALRSVNPSPYLFYFDHGDFRIFGSSPEAQLVIKDKEAQIHPIAGTAKRSGNDTRDKELAEALLNDKKERAEHVMLVDLARNDLSRNCHEVKVDVFSEVQYYSHVIHLVSKVTGKMKKGAEAMQVFADTFPAGTLSGAPKVKAMNIINDCEHDARGYYGGAIGFMGFNGDLNHAIIIRSFLSKNNTLYYRAGAGVVIASKEENELQEVNNKLAALRAAIEKAEEL